MSRDITLASLQSLYRQETDDVFLILLTIDHGSLSAPIRVTSDSVDTVSRGESFVAFPFDLSLPEDSETLSATAKLQIDNIDRQIIAAMRQMTTMPTVLLEIIRAAAPDIVEASFPDFRLSQIQYDALTISGELTIEDFTAEPYPSGVFGPANFSGLF